MLSSAKNGPHTAHAGGTGLLPFMDLVNLIWKNRVSEGFVLYLYASFSSEND